MVVNSSWHCDASSHHSAARRIRDVKYSNMKRFVKSLFVRYSSPCKVLL